MKSPAGCAKLHLLWGKTNHKEKVEEGVQKKDLRAKTYSTFFDFAVKNSEGRTGGVA
jgi:hypothetical protein